MSETEKKCCCICGDEFSEYGNNPEPLGRWPDRCCNDCNNRFVIPVRVMFGRDDLDDNTIKVLCRIAGLGKAFAWQHERAREMASLRGSKPL